MDDRLGLARWAAAMPVRVRAVDSRDLYRRAPHPPLKDYSSAVAAAIAWLGNRYLLAQPVNGPRRTSSVKGFTERTITAAPSLTP
jgi:hypothetical protein